MKIPKLKTSAKVAVMYVAVLICLELVGQLAIRIIEARRPSNVPAENMLSDSEPVLGFGLKKNFNESYPDWSVQTNRWGFRESVDFPKQKPEDEVRVFLIGGSTVFGWALDAQDSIPRHLQALADAAIKQTNTTKKVRIINAGVPWYASWHEAALVFFRVMEFQPDWIIAVDGLNDTAMALAPQWQPIVAGFVDTPTRIAAESRAARAGGSWIKSVLELSPTLRYVNARIQHRAATKHGTFRPEAWDQYIAYHRRLKILAEKTQVKYSVYFQPVMMVDKPLEYFETSHNGTATQDAEFADVFRKQYLEGERRVLAEAELNAFSLKSLFGQVSQPIYLDGLHYNSKGNRSIAEAIFEQEFQRFLTDLPMPPIENPAS